MGRKVMEMDVPGRQRRGRSKKEVEELCGGGYEREKPAGTLCAG